MVLGYLLNWDPHLSAVWESGVVWRDAYIYSFNGQKVVSRLLTADKYVVDRTIVIIEYNWTVGCSRSVGLIWPLEN